MFNAYLKLQKDISKKSLYKPIKKAGYYELFDYLDSYYLMDDKVDYIKSNRLRKPKYKIAANKGYKHLSGVFMPNESNWGYGDVRTSNKDLLIFYLTEDLMQIEIFVAIGKANEWNLVMNLLLDGKLEEELNEWRK